MTTPDDLPPDPQTPGSREPGGTPAFVTKELLREIRDHTDWRALFLYLGLTRDRKSNASDWWAISPLNPEEKHASFHMNDQGWSCFSTGENGYVIELVQKVLAFRTGRALNCYEAGKWLLENGLSRVSTGSGTDSPPLSAASAAAPGAAGGEGEATESRAEEGFPCNSGDGGHRDGAGTGGDEAGRDEGGSGGKQQENRPIRQTLLPSLVPEHPELERRGISRETCGYLGCGYLPESSKSPLAGRIVFQVRGVREDEENTGSLKPVILTHIGRALTEEQEETDGKWKLYGGFSKTLELYNIDKVLLDEEAVRQARETGHVIVTEGCFDVGKLTEAGIKNAVATFGWSLSEEQIRKLERIAEKTGVNRFLFWLDRDSAGLRGQEKARERLRDSDKILSEGFDWKMTFPSPARGEVRIPQEIGDVCEFSVEQLRWLRGKGVI